MLPNMVAFLHQYIPFAFNFWDNFEKKLKIITKNVKNIDTWYLF